METNPKIGPARKETSKIARKLKLSDEKLRKKLQLLCSVCNHEKEMARRRKPGQSK